MTRGTRWERALALRDDLWATATSGRAFTDAVLERFRLDRSRYSDILEWSLCEDENGIDVARFSYAFPGYAQARDDTARTVVSCVQTLGAPALEAARVVMKAARHRAVEQVLVGFAHGAAGAPRAKFYLQFRHDAGAAAAELARRIVGTRRATGSDAYPLHLLGLDVGAEGLAGAKLYFLEAQEKPWFPAWSRPLCNVLRIHRLRQPDDPGFEQPTEIDFSLSDNALPWAELRAAPVLEPFRRGLDRFAELEQRFRLRPRRVSLALGSARKLNVYYVLDESEPVSGTKPPVGG